MSTTVDARIMVGSKPATAGAERLSDLDRFLASVERRAFRMATAAIGDADEAMDIVQESMIKLARLYRNKSAEEWRPLFYRILQNRIRDYYRRQRVRKLLRLDYDPDPDNFGLSEEQLIDRGGAAPEQWLQHDQTLERLEAAIRSLPRRQREAFFLRHWEGLSTRETARAMRVTEGSVKTHLSRAMQHLSAAIELNERESDDDTN